MQLSRLRPTLSYANVASTLALVIATSMGGAYAHGLIGTEDIQRNAVKSRHIDAQQVKRSDIRKNAITSNRVKNGSLRAHDFAARADGVALAGAFVDINGAVNHWFNRVGGDIRVTEQLEGTYEVKVPGTRFDGWSRTVYSVDGVINYCFLNDARGSTLEIKCRDRRDDMPTPSWFSFVIYEDAVGAVDPTDGAIAPRTPADAR